MEPGELRDSMRQNVILRVVSKLLIPVILLFAFYVQWHGDFGPGGGFQAGVIFAAGFILYALIFDIDTARTVISARLTRMGLAAGVLLYSLVGVATMLMGGDFLDYSVLAGDMVDETTGWRERLDEASRRQITEDARRALRQMITLTEAAQG